MRKFLHGVLHSHRPEKLFLLIAIPFTLIFLVTIPALQGWDEATHFLRAYQISQGNMRADKLGPHSWGGHLPVNVLQMNDSFVSDLVHSAQSGLHRSVHTQAYSTYLKVFTPDKVTAPRNFESSAVYSPVAYAAPAAGIALARLVHMPLLSYIYAARFAALLVWLILMYQAIKRVPAGKWLLFALALLPTTMTQAVSMAPDGLLIGAAALLGAVYIDHLLRPRRFSAKELIVTFILALILGLVKETYILLILLFLLLPLVNFGSRKRYLAINALIILPALVLGALWAASVGGIAQDIHFAQRPGLDVNPKEQITYIEHHPFNYMGILLNQAINNNTNPLYLEFTGSITWKGVLLPQWAILLSYLALIYGCYAVFEELRQSTYNWSTVNKLARYGPLVILLSTIAVIYTSIYVSFSVVRSPNIEGMQGRYFLPLVPLIIPALLIPSKKAFLKLNLAMLPRCMAALSIFVLLVALTVLIAANYIPDIFV